MTAKKRDTRHKEIREALKNAGFACFDTGAVGDGYPDLVVANRRGTAALLYEIKSEGGVFTEDECRFMLKLVHPVYRVITTPEQAIEVLQNEG